MGLAVDALRAHPGCTVLQTYGTRLLASLAHDYCDAIAVRPAALLRRVQPPRLPPNFVPGLPHVVLIEWMQTLISRWFRPLFRDFHDLGLVFFKPPSQTRTRHYCA